MPPDRRPQPMFSALLPAVFVLSRSTVLGRIAAQWVGSARLRTRPRIVSSGSSARAPPDARFSRTRCFCPVRELRRLFASHRSLPAGLCSAAMAAIHVSEKTALDAASHTTAWVASPSPLFTLTDSLTLSSSSQDHRWSWSVWPRRLDTVQAAAQAGRRRVLVRLLRLFDFNSFGLAMPTDLSR